jgi:hypothetical protein
MIQMHVRLSYLGRFNGHKNITVGSAMVNMITVDREFNSRWGQTNDHTIVICCFSGKHAALRRKSKDWLARNQDGNH